MYKINLNFQFLHRLGVARWFVSRAGGFGSNDEVKKNIIASRKECAKAYHQLHQVKLTTVVKLTPIKAFKHFFLAFLNSPFSLKTPILAVYLPLLGRLNAKSKFMKLKI